jgi:cellulose synthase/poly-beta-1,6-N-acetylglucosamine synthase-like glycosyltransferase
MGGYFSSIKVDDVASATNATNDAEHDDVLVLSEQKVDPLEIKNDESGLIVLDDDDKDKEKDKEKEKCDEFASRTTVNDVVYTKKNIKKKNKNKKKGKLLHLS